MLGEFRQFVDVALHVVGLEHHLAATLGQPVNQRVDLRGWRGDAKQIDPLGGHDRCAGGRGELQHYCGQLQQAAADAVVVGHCGKHLHDALAQIEQSTGI